MGTIPLRRWEGWWEASKHVRPSLGELLCDSRFVTPDGTRMFRFPVPNSNWKLQRNGRRRALYYRRGSARFFFSPSEEEAMILCSRRPSLRGFLPRCLVPVLVSRMTWQSRSTGCSFRIRFGGGEGVTVGVGETSGDSVERIPSGIDPIHLDIQEKDRACVPLIGGQAWKIST